MVKKMVKWWKGGKCKFYITKNVEKIGFDEMVFFGQITCNLFWSGLEAFPHF